MDKERRGSLRIKKPLIAQYGYSVDKEKIKWDMTTVRDISATGMCISIDRCLVSGEILYFRIKLPNAPFQSLDLMGRVIESKAAGFITRIEFINLNEGQRHLLQEYSKCFSGTHKSGG